jgi:hypothetical protein
VPLGILMSTESSSSGYPMGIHCGYPGGVHFRDLSMLADLLDLVSMSN